jgi:hypothetical protein
VRLLPPALPLALVLSACASGPLEALPDDRRPSTYRVGVAAASGDRTVTSIYTLRVVPRRDDVWAFTTTDAEGSWEEGAAAITWDSDQPQGSDPWPITLQHAISSIPAPIQMGPRGAPERLVDPETWRSAARQALEDTDLPPAAVASGASLVDPEGVVRDLRRNFPGLPPEEGPWIRDETIAGVSARRVEACRRERSRGRTTWTCQGRVEGPTEGAARLVDATSSTTLVVDRRGLSSLEYSYDGTLVVLAPDGQQALDRAVAGRRKVVRIDDADRGPVGR